MYNFIKGHKEYVYNKYIPQQTCLCEICENVVLLAEGINKLIQYISRLILVIYWKRTAMIQRMVSCISSMCEGCAKVNLRAEVFCTVQSESNDVETEDTVIQYQKWINNNGTSNTMNRVTTETNVEETVQLFQNLMEGKYIHCKRHL